MAQPRNAKQPARRTPAKNGPARGAKRAPSHAAPSVWRRHERDLWIVALLLVGVLALLLNVGALGPAGRVANRGLGDVMGVARYGVTALLLLLGVGLVSGKVAFERSRFTWGFVLVLLSVSGLGDVLGGRPAMAASSSDLGRAGGWLGVAVGGNLASWLGGVGAFVLLFALLVVAFMITTGIGLRALVAGAVAFSRAVGRRLGQWWVGRPRPNERYEAATVETPPARQRRVKAAPVEPPPAPTSPHAYEEEFPEEIVAEYEVPEVEPAPKPVAKKERAARSPVPIAAGSWTLPPLSLLSRTKEQRQDHEAIEAAGRQLVDALQAHGVETSLVGFTVGPTVTRYELELGPGVKVARVTSLNKDIAYAMATPDVRILAPIPGRQAIGIEVPNRQRQLIVLGDLLAAPESEAATHPLDVPIGRDISGKTVVVNLGEMPHVLISGATGAGKSSCINSLVTSLVMRATPDQLKLLLIDPKRVEMGQYNDLPHLLAPVVVDPKKAAGALSWAVKEMERRYDILAACGARDITGYQQMLARGELTPAPTIAQEVADAVERATGLPSDAPEPEGPEVLPYVVIIVDELNDLMMVAARDVEESVVRIAQMARAVGIHLVLATQRPSVDVITGVIKANVPSRMAFAVSSLADSRVILDQAGAERLIGKGDMLLVTASSNIARRLQSPWVSEEEVRHVVENWKAQGGRRETVVALDERPGLTLSGGASLPTDDDDGLLRQAREIVIETQSGSTSMLQRRLRVGFARAGRLMDQLELEGVVAPGDGSKARAVLISKEQYDNENL